MYWQSGTLVGVSGTGDEEAGETHLLPKQLLSSSISSYGFSLDGGSSGEKIVFFQNKKSMSL